MGQSEGRPGPSRMGSETEKPPMRVACSSWLRWSSAPQGGPPIASCWPDANAHSIAVRLSSAPFAHRL